jgi:hypothetical protein
LLVYQGITVFNIEQDKNGEFGGMYEEIVVVDFTLSYYLEMPGETEENHETLSQYGSSSAIIKTMFLLNVSVM